MEIKVRYYLDNDTWSDEEFEDAGDIENVFVITKDMINDLIREKVKLSKGDFISEMQIL